MNKMLITDLEVGKKSFFFQEPNEFDFFIYCFLLLLFFCCCCFFFLFFFFSLLN